MPLDDDARVAITLRLRTAHAETHENYTRKPAWIEILGDVALAQQWLTIGATYSGIEQTLKYLIALQKDLTVDELLVKNGIVEKPREEPERPTRYRIHHLGTLFSRLDRQTKEAVEHDYAVWQSLYDYLTIPTCAEFLDRIQGDDNEGTSTGATALFSNISRRPTARTRCSRYGLRSSAGARSAREYLTAPALARPTRKSGLASANAWSAHA